MYFQAVNRLRWYRRAFLRCEITHSRKSDFNDSWSPGTVVCNSTVYRCAKQS